MQYLLSWGSQYGGPKSYKVVGWFDDLFQSLSKEYRSDHYYVNLENLNITWRIAGKIFDFDGGEGPERIRFWRKDHFIGVDMVVPIRAWKDQTETEILYNLIELLERSFEAVFARALKEKEIANENLVRGDFEKLMKKFEKVSLKKIKKNAV